MELSRDRDCPVCSGTTKSLLFRQSFDELSQGSLMTGFDLVVCTSCGAGYADSIPAQADFDRYYKEMSKYEYANNSGVQSETYLRNFRTLTELVVPFVGQESRVLDIGCATGGLLAEFQRRGFTNLHGIDPSPACAKITEQLYGIKAEALTISELDQVREASDLVLLTGVLEHLRDLDDSIKAIRTSLTESGLLFVVVPDATRYHQHSGAPFQYFSMEHINYFSPTSLTNLMSRHGFSPVFVERVPLHLSPQAVEPTVGGLFRRDADKSLVFSPTHDHETRSSLELYIESSQSKEQEILSRIASICTTARAIAVWGAGTHTLRLLRTSNLASANITCFIDSNVKYQGKTLVGRPIVSPSAFLGKDVEILISSQTAEEEIYQKIQSLGWSCKVHRLYSLEDA